MDNNKKTPEPVAAGPGADAVASQNPTNSIAQTEAESKPGYYAVLGRVRYDSNIPPMARLLCAEISALISPEGYCWASNGKFADLYAISESQVGRHLQALEKAGYITRRVIRDPESHEVTQRRIYLCEAAGQVMTPPRKNAESSPQKCIDPPRKNERETNLSITNIPPISPKGDGTPETKKKGRRKPKQTGAEAWAVLGEWSKSKSRSVRDRLVSFVDACRDRNPKSGANPLTAPAAKMLVNKLDRLSHGNEAVMAAMLDEAIEHNWQTVYEHDRGNASSVGAVPNAPAEELMGGFWDD